MTARRTEGFFDEAAGTMSPDELRAELEETYGMTVRQVVRLRADVVPVPDVAEPGRLLDRRVFA